MSAETYQGSDGMTRRVLRAGFDDKSPIYAHWQPGRYDSRCSSCWLGFSHSEAKHDAARRAGGAA
jgi:hypothetical protein